MATITQAPRHPPPSTAFNHNPQTTAHHHRRPASLSASVRAAMRGWPLASLPPSPCCCRRDRTWPRSRPFPFPRRSRFSPLPLHLSVSFLCTTTVTRPKAAVGAFEVAAVSLSLSLPPSALLSLSALNNPSLSPSLGVALSLPRSAAPRFGLRRGFSLPLNLLPLVDLTVALASRPSLRPRRESSLLPLGCHYFSVSLSVPPSSFSAPSLSLSASLPLSSYRRRHCSLPFLSQKLDDLKSQCCF